MPCEFYSAEEPRFKPNERRQYERVKNQLSIELGANHGRYCFIVDHIVGAHQHDLILIKTDALVSIDLKGYKGGVLGTENGPWEVEMKDGKTVPINQDQNPFKQARGQRYGLIRYFNGALPKLSRRFSGQEIHNIGSVLCFEAGSTFDYGQIDSKRLPWFKVTDEDQLARTLIGETSDEFAFRDSEIDALLEYMGVRKLDLESEDIPDDTPPIWNPEIDNTLITLGDDVDDTDAADGDVKDCLPPKKIPDYIEKRHVELALDYIDKHGWPMKHNSKSWDLVSRGTRYPPKYVILVSNHFVEGERIRFTATMANRYLTRLAYTVVNKSTGAPWARR